MFLIQSNGTLDLHDSTIVAPGGERLRTEQSIRSIKWVAVGDTTPHP